MPPVFPSLDEAPKAPVFPRLDKEPVFPDLEEDESSWDYLFRKGRQTAAIADEEPPPPPQVPEPQLYSSFGATAAPPKFGASEFKPPMTRERMATRGAALKRYGFDPDAGTTEDERAAARGLQPANVIMSPTGQKYVPADNLVDAAGQRIGGIASAHLPRQVQRALLRGVDAMGVSNLAPDDGSWTDTIDPHRTGELGGLYNISRNIPETVKDVAEYGAEQVQRPFRGEAPEAPEWLQNAWETTKGHFTGPQGDTRDGWTAPWEMGWWGPESAAEAENMWGKTWETVRHLPQFPIQMYNLIAGSERPSHKAQGIAEIPGGIAHSMYDTGKTAALHGPGGTFSKKGLIQPFIDASIGAELGAAGLRSAGRARIMKAESELGRNAEIARNAEPNWGANPADLRDYANDLITGKHGGNAPPDFTHGEVVADYGGGLKMVRLPESGGVVEYGLVHNNRLIGRGQASRAVEDGLGDVARPTRPGEGTLGLDQIAVLPEFKGMGFGQKILSEMNKDGVDLTRNMRTEGMVSPNAIAAQRRFHETNQSPFEFKEEVIPEKSLVPYEYSDVGLGRGKLEYVHEAAPKVAARAAEWAERASEAQEAQAAAAAEIGAQQKALDVANKSLETGKLEPELAAAGRAALKDAQREARKGLEPKTRPTPEDILLKRERELGSKPAEELSPEGRARHEELRAEWVEAKTPRKTHEPTAVPDKTQLSKPYQTAEYLRETINDIRQAGKEQAEGAAKSAEAGLEAAQKWHEAASKDATRLTAEAGRLKQLASDLEASIHRELVPHVRKNLSARHQRMLKQAETLENTAKALELSKHLLNPLAPLLAINWIKNLYIGRRHKSGKHTPESTAKMLWALRAGDRPGLAKFREEQRLAEREVNDWYLQMSKDMSTIAEENQGTVYEMMHQENYFSQFALEQWVEINPFAEAGQRVKLREGVKDVPPRSRAGSTSPAKPTGCTSAATS